MEHAKTLGELLRTLREKAGISQEDLAIGIGLSQGHVAHIENNTRYPSLLVFAKFVMTVGATDEQIGDLVKARVAESMQKLIT